MAFHDVEIPSAFEYGSVGGIGFRTDIQVTATGHELRLANQAHGRHRFLPRKPLLTSSDATTLKNFAIGRRGSLHSFKLKDWSDYTTNSDGTTAPAATDQVIGTGTGAQQYLQLRKTYLVGQPGEYARAITVPETGSVVVAVNGTPTGSFTVSAAGIVTITATIGHTITAGCEFRVPVRFEKSVDEWMRLQAVAYDRWSAEDIGCVEVLDETQLPEPWYAGGSRDVGTLTTDFSLTYQQPQMTLVKATAAINCFLPSPSYHPGGADVFVIAVDATSTNTVQIRDDAGNTVGAALTAGSIGRLALVRGASSSTWFLT